MRLAAIQSAYELYGDDEVAAVVSAFDAVGIVGDEGSSAPEDSDPVQGEQWIAVVNNEVGDHCLLRGDPEDDSVINTITNTQVFTGTGNPITINGVGTQDGKLCPSQKGFLQTFALEPLSACQNVQSTMT